MAKLIRRQAVVKRRDFEADRNFDGRVTMVDALEIVIRIYESEGYRERTIIDYRRHWAEFSEIVDVKYIDVITSDIVRGYISNLLKERGLSPVTVNIRLSAIRAIFNRLLDEGIISESPLAKIRKLRVDEQKLFTLTDNQIKRLFSVIDKNSFAGFRDYCAMITMLYCGLRINEINALEIADIDFENNVIMLPGPKNKNRKTRAVPISAKVKNELLQLITETREYFGTVSHVFTNQFGEPLRDDLIRKRMDNYARTAGLKDECRASPHSLRHTFATNFLKNGGNIRALMAILGHSDISTTQIYLNYTDDQLIEQYNEVIENNPLDV